jgi:1,4-dihydroxy-2-naphthoate octaprenyltransferase
VVPLSILLRELRAEFLTASTIPVVLTLVVVRHETGSIDSVPAALTLLGVVFIHLGANIANDYFDHRSGNDAANVDFARPFTGGSRLIQQGLISPGSVLAISVCFFAAAIAIGIALVVMRGFVVLALGIVGLASGFFYTAPPLRLAARGLGELVVGLCFGMLVAAGTCYVQTASVSAGCLVAAVPISLLITAVIIINEFQDADADESVGRRTLVVRLGRRRGVVLYGVVTLAAYPAVAVGATAGPMPRFCLLALATLPLALKAVLAARRFYDDPRRLAAANALTIVTHLATGALLIVGYLAG